jgi:hypothetical protein
MAKMCEVRDVLTHASEGWRAICYREQRHDESWQDGTWMGPIRSSITDATNDLQEHRNQAPEVMQHEGVILHITPNPS